METMRAQITEDRPQRGPVSRNASHPAYLGCGVLFAFVVAVPFAYSSICPPAQWKTTRKGRHQSWPGYRGLWLREARKDFHA